MHPAADDLPVAGRVVGCRAGQKPSSTRARLLLACALLASACAIVLAARQEARGALGSDVAWASTRVAPQAKTTSAGRPPRDTTRDVSDLFQAIEKGRAPLIDALLRAHPEGRTAVPSREDPLEHVIRARIDAAAGRYREARAAGSRLQASEARRALEDARSELAARRAAAWRALARLGAAQRPGPHELEALQARLAPGEALVSYGELDRALYAAVATRLQVRALYLGPAAGIEALLESIADEDPGPASAALEQLGARLVEPLALPEGARRVILSLPPALARAPLDTLLPDVRVHRVPSAAALALLRARAPRHGESVLALGGVDYTAIATRSAAWTRGGRDLPRLPESRAEAAAIGERILLGREATETGLRRALAEPTPWRAVHLAGHVVADEARPLLSAFVLAPTDADDGLLTVDEVLGLDVRADLVLLSACASGVGSDAAADEVGGLAPAFLVAGARGVVGSLWDVDDAATRALMERFHALWNPGEGAGVPAAQALRAARDHVRAQPRWAHPRFWAGWALWGLSE